LPHIPKRFYAKFEGVTEHYQRWSLGMIAVYDVLLSKTPRVEKEFGGGVAKTTLRDLEKILPIQLAAIHRAMKKLIADGYVRRVPGGYEIVNFFGDEPVKGENFERVDHVVVAVPKNKKRKCPVINLITPCDHNDHNGKSAVIKKITPCDHNDHKTAALKNIDQNISYRKEIGGLEMSNSDFVRFQEVIDQAIKAVKLSRKTGKIADSVRRKIQEKLSRYPPDIVVEAVRVFVTKHAGKDERYLIGIARRMAKEKQMGIVKPVESATEHNMRVVQELWKETNDDATRFPEIVGVSDSQLSEPTKNR
jgi:hypothetical protein